MSRGVPRRGGGWSRGFGVLLLATLAIVAGTLALPAEAFSTAANPRGTTAEVVQDTTGVVGLDKAGRVQKNSRDRLVTVTNNFDTVREFRLSLVENDGDLYYDTDGDGALENVGTSVRITLSPGDSTDVYVEATGQPNTLLEYDVTDTLASGDDGSRFDMRRSADIQAGNGGN